MSKFLRLTIGIITATILLFTLTIRAKSFPSALALDVGKWNLTGSMHIARYQQTATLLPNGKILVAGGRNINNDGTALASTEYVQSNYWKVEPDR